MSSESPVAAARRVHGTAVAIPAVRVITLLLLFGAAAVYESIHLSSLADPDVWWHLRTGLWILQNHAVPRSGIFSQYSALPWTAGSWGYDLLLAAAYKLIGLRAVPLSLMLLKVALAVSAFLLGRGRGRRFWLAVLLAIAAQYALLHLRPLPNLCSLVLFSIELALLFQSRRTGNARVILWLPLLFVLWANLDIQFVYGLSALGLFLASVLAEEICHRYGITWISHEPAMPVGAIGAVAAVSLAATLLSPYTDHVYEAVIKNASPAAYVAGQHAMNFRHPQHYVLLLLAMAAFLVLGRRRSHDLFKITLMIASAVVSFRMQCDAGFLALVSVAVIGDAFAIDHLEIQQENGARLGRWESLATAGLLLVVGVAAACRIPSSRAALLKKIGENFPVQACDEIRGHHLRNPLFNEYQWGGFLTWYLPEYPVAIDGRRDLYGEDINLRYFNVTSAEIPLNANPDFASAQTFLLPANSAIAAALATIPDFKVVYRDDLAMVLVRQN
ncbi:MAG: hypothetical protein ACLQMO_01050 [Acidobacteriaceae bacterium]